MVSGSTGCDIGNCVGAGSGRELTPHVFGHNPCWLRFRAREIARITEVLASGPAGAQSSCRRAADGGTTRSPGWKALSMAGHPTTSPDSCQHQKIHRLPAACRTESRRSAIICANATSSIRILPGPEKSASVPARPTFRRPLAWKNSDCFHAWVPRLR